VNEIPIPVLLGLLCCLLLMSAFFSGSETGLMTLNRYRLKHLARSNHRGAKRAQALLERPDKLIGVILIGNNVVNILASAIATVIGLRVWGDSGIAIATGALTFTLLIVGEVLPKTYSAFRPEKVAFPAGFVLQPLMVLLSPLVYVLNGVCNSILQRLGVKTDAPATEALSREELRTIVNEAGSMISRHHKSMLLSIIDLEDMTVEDIMVPKADVVGIDIDSDTEEIVDQLRSTQHTRLAVYRSDINNPLGVLHLRKVSRLLLETDITKSAIMQHVSEPYYVPEGTPLHKQLINFQKSRKRMGFVVDEYGEVQGIVTLEDILEEIVGEFTTDPGYRSEDIHPQEDGSYIVDGGVSLRDLNRAMKWSLPTNGPRTLSGLITERLEMIPETSTCIRVGKYVIETVQTKGNVVRTARIIAPVRKS
jgi:Mg2+/Co2+ transporter CorB